MSAWRRPNVLTRPEQGWSSLLLLLGMLVLLGVSVADARPLELDGHGALSASLPAVMVAAGLIGFMLARSSLGVVRAHVVGALVAAMVLLLVTGAALLGQPPLPTELAGIGERISAVWMRLDSDIGLLVTQEIKTSTITVYLVLGALSWTTAQFGAFSVFRYDRGGPAVMAVGTVLFLNLGLPVQVAEDRLPVVPVLAIFAGLALLLLMRLQLMQQRFAWARRHISDTRDVSRLFLRTGVAFVLIAVVSASSLTVLGTVEARDVDIQGLEEPLEDLVDRLSDVLEFVGVPVNEELAPPLGAETELRTTWTPGDGTAFTATVDGGLYGNYWWGKADNEYDFQNGRWLTTPVGNQVDVGVNGPLAPSDEASAGGFYRAGVRITIGDSPLARRNLFRPPEADSSASHALRVRETPGGGVSDIEYPEPLDEGDTVSFLSYVRDYEPGNESLTGNELRATHGAPYPEWVTDHYLIGGDDRRIVGEQTRMMADRIKRAGSTPYDWAVQVQRELRAMEYDTDISGDCDAFDGVFTECLLAIERGFCQQYATTMVMLMRAMGVPARFVTGYLRGELDQQGRWVVEQAALHNWVEVYFPDDVGWVRFDPTPGLESLGQVPTELEDGPDVPESVDEPLDEVEPGQESDPETPEPTLPPPVGPDEPSGSSGDGGTAVFISLGVLAALLATVASTLLLFRLRRLPAGDDSLAYRGIVSLATRLGYGPHPSQTEYEYASTLSETIPSVREDLFVVTGAQVQTAYGARKLDEEYRSRLRAAYARIRTALLRLSIRWRR